MAAYHGKDWAIDTLLRLGANLQAINDKQQQPLQVARHNTVRSMLWPSMTPGEREPAAVSAGAIQVECPAGRPQDYDLEEQGTMDVSTIGESDFYTRGSSGGVEGKLQEDCVHEEVWRLSSGSVRSEQDGRRQQDNTLSSINARTDSTPEHKLFKRMMDSDCLANGLGESEEEKNDPFVVNVVGDPIFEEGSSEGEFSLDSEGELL